MKNKMEKKAKKSEPLTGKTISQSPVDMQAFMRNPEQLDLIQKLIKGPDELIPNRTSDEELDRLALKLKLIEPENFNLASCIVEELSQYVSKFKMPWFYKLADIAG